MEYRATLVVEFLQSRAQPLHPRRLHHSAEPSTAHKSRDWQAEPYHGEEARQEESVQGAVGGGGAEEFQGSGCQ